MNQIDLNSHFALRQSESKAFLANTVNGISLLYILTCFVFFKCYLERLG